MRSSRKNRPEKTSKNVRRGVKPVGENKIIWKAKLEMKEMFVKGRLLRGAVPLTTAVTPTSMPVPIIEEKSKCATVPPSQVLKPKTEVAMSALQGHGDKDGKLLQKSRILETMDKQVTIEKSTKMRKMLKCHQFFWK